MARTACSQGIAVDGVVVEMEILQNTMGPEILPHALRGNVIVSLAALCH